MERLDFELRVTGSLDVNSQEIFEQQAALIAEQLGSMSVLQDVNLQIVRIDVPFRVRETVVPDRFSDFLQELEEQYSWNREKPLQRELIKDVLPCLGSVLRAQRESLGYSSQEVADRVGMSRFYYTQIEAGAMAPTNRQNQTKQWRPPKAGLAKIASTLGFPPIDVLYVAGYEASTDELSVLLDPSTPATQARMGERRATRTLQ